MSTAQSRVSARPVTFRRWQADTGVALLRTTPESVAEYRATWVAERDLPTFGQLVNLCERVGLRGRGGAGFQLATKLRAVRESARSAGVTPVVVANGDESEPASAKDRYLLRHRPQLVLDGLAIAAHALGACRAVVYLADEDLAASLRDQLRDRPGSTAGVPVEIVVAAERYVAGEETALVRMIDEGIPKPVAKPPRPYERGVAGRPTLVANVETLAHLARAVRLGADAITATGTAEEPGVTLLTLVPDVGEPCLVETPFGVPLTDLLRHCGLLSADRPANAVLTGGFFGGFLPRAQWDLPIGHASMRAAGTTLGCGSVLVVTESCPVDVAHELLDYFARENAQQCGVCINGTRAMADALGRIAAHTAEPADPERLRRWSQTLPGRGDCALLDAACRIVSTLFAHTGGLVRSHLERACAGCARGHDRTPRTRFEVGLPRPMEGLR